MFPLLTTSSGRHFQFKTMNREIKFRVWDGEEIIYQDELGSFRDVALNTHPVKQTIKVDTAIRLGIEVMQYTGLKDKNGKEIYEGDIIITANGAQSTICFGEWQYFEDENTRIYGIGFSFDGCEPFAASAEGSKGYEVIGNMYSTPELL